MCERELPDCYVYISVGSPLPQQPHHHHTAITLLMGLTTVGDTAQVAPVG